MVLDYTDTSNSHKLLLLIKHLLIKLSNVLFLTGHVFFLLIMELFHSNHNLDYLWADTLSDPDAN